MVRTTCLKPLSVVSPIAARVILLLLLFLCRCCHRLTWLIDRLCDAPSNVPVVSMMLRLRWSTPPEATPWSGAANFFLVI